MRSNAIAWKDPKVTDHLVDYIDSPHGVIAYRDVGDPQLPPVLFLHGSGPGVTGWRNFGHTIAAFEKTFRCIVMELPGFGISDHRPGHPVVTAREACLDLLEMLGVRAIDIVGNSMGAIVGAGLATVAPERVRRLIAIGGLGTQLMSAAPSEGVRLLSAFLTDPDRRSLRRWLESMVHDAAIITEEIVTARWEQAGRPDVLAAMRRLYDPAAIASASHGKAAFDLREVQCPTLLLWGRDDRVTPVDMALMPMQLIPNAELHVLPRCGHWVMIEQQSAFERLTREHLTRS